MIERWHWMMRIDWYRRIQTDLVLQCLLKNMLATTDAILASLDVSSSEDYLDLLKVGQVTAYLTFHLLSLTTCFMVLQNEEDMLVRKSFMLYSFYHMPETKSTQVKLCRSFLETLRSKEELAGAEKRWIRPSPCFGETWKYCTVEKSASATFQPLCLHYLKTWTKPHGLQRI